jgi:hypothetical protein
MQTVKTPQSPEMMIFFIRYPDKMVKVVKSNAVMLCFLVFARWINFALQNKIIQGDKFAFRIVQRLFIFGLLFYRNFS